jgi:hypothetical protein
MRDSTKGAIFIVLFGSFLILVFMMFTFWKKERIMTDTSDGVAVKTTVRICGDGYLGYWFMTSAEMKRVAAKKAMGVNFTDDKGAYSERLKKFAAGEYDMIVLPVNSYLQHGAAYNYPGVIVATVAESKGADGIVGFADRFPKGRIQELNNPGLKVVFTPDSPSSFLMDLVITDFDLARLRASNDWRVEANGSEEVAKKAVQRAGDAFVMWEPDLSRALHDNPNLKQIWGSDQFRNYIVDVFVVHRDFLQRHEGDVRVFFESYFSAMRSYTNNRATLLDDMVKSTGLKADVVEGMLDKIDWYDLDENARLSFGVQTGANVTSTEGVINTILACQNVLSRTGKLQGDPLKGNPYLIVNSSIVKELVKSAPATLGNGGGVFQFSQIDDAAWSRLREIGPLRVTPITFQSGVNLLDDDGKHQVDVIASMLINNYPQYRIVVRGHTGPGDDEENRKLSLERAQVVVQYLTTVHEIDPSRIHAEGMGSTRPPERLPGESMRALQYRMPRVEFVLIEGNSL